MLERVKSTFLPVDILKVYVHGSYLRGDDLPGDLDIVILLKVKDDWRKWSESFSSLNECHDLIWKCYETGMTLKDAIDGPLSSEMEKRGIPIEWVNTMSWSELWGRTAVYIPYMLMWDVITRRILKKGMKGIHIQFEATDQIFASVHGRLYSYYDMPVFQIWTRQFSERNELEPNTEELEVYLKLEREKLQKDMADASFLKSVGEFLIEKSLLTVPKEKLGDVALQVLLGTPKYEVPEDVLRGVLGKFEIPEEKVYTTKRRGIRTWYNLARDEAEETELRARVKDIEEKNAAELTIKKLSRRIVPLNEASKIDCFVSEADVGRVTIQITKDARMDEKTFREIWEKRGFEVETFSGTVSAEKSVTLAKDLDKHELSLVLNRYLRGG
jgi:hypothetical protein